ncbi:MAG: tetraacyldisaccharide 4'-kinase [Bacteroidales bacterium]|nr:tetraacyldisaccharide 4'-kinase [Bacteroidales bacterium]
MSPLRLLLLPVMPFYALAVWVRNRMFDAKILPTQKSQTPTICVGNLCVGGSGKTPHVEYLIRLLKSEFKVCTLSRGYGRKSKGFIFAKGSASSALLGDESMQYFQKFPDISVCVDVDRRRAIRNLKTEAPNTDVILLDDAFQYRYVDAGLKILLTDYFSPYYNDYLLPIGHLREQRSAAKRADIIVVTKCPPVFSPIVKNDILKKIKPKPNQDVYFSYMKHGELHNIDGSICKISKDAFNHFVVISGIYNPYPLVEHLRTITKDVKLFQFPDHHEFTTSELKRIRKYFLDYYCNYKYIVTTEKDLMRLKDSPAFAEISDLPICYVPVEVEFHKDGKKEFDNQVLEYVRKHNRASDLNEVKK